MAAPASDRPAMSVSRAPGWLAVLSVIAGCGGPAPVPSDGGGGDAPATPAHATASWRVRCDDLGGCTPPPIRTIDGDHGAGGLVVTCDATSFDGVERFLELDVVMPGSHGVHVSGATFPLAGGRVGGDSCTVDVDESADGALRGACGANTPTAEVPCQIQRLTIDAGTLSFEIRCDGVEIVGAPGVTRELGPPESAAGFASIEVTGCRGL